MNRTRLSQEMITSLLLLSLIHIWQQFINEVELFFLLGKPIKWEKKNGNDDVYQMFLDFIDKTRFNVTMRKVRCV